MLFIGWCWELNALTFRLQHWKSHHCERFLGACRSPWEDCWKSISWGAVLTVLSFNPERHNVRAAVWESSWLHQGVIRRWCVEAGQRESRCQVTLLCHSSGTVILCACIESWCIRCLVCVQPSQRVCSYFYSVCFCLKPNSPDIKTCFFSLYICVYLQVYSESVIPRIAKAASGVTGTPYNELMNSWGVYFLGFVGKYGYDRILKVKKKSQTRHCQNSVVLR